jgi:hypothetical protein
MSDANRTHEVIAVTGGRDYRPSKSDIDRLVRFITLRGVQVLRHGDCRGLDKLLAAGVDACFAEDDERLVIEAWPAFWGRHGASAGPRRNREMLAGDWSERGRDAAGKRADLLIAYPGGQGTASCVGLARGLGITVIPVAELPR